MILAKMNDKTKKNKTKSHFYIPVSTLRPHCHHGRTEQLPLGNIRSSFRAHQVAQRSGNLENMTT